MQNGNFEEYTYIGKINRHRVRNAHSHYLERSGWVNSRIPCYVALEFCVRKPAQDQCFSGMGFKCAGRHFVWAERV